MGNTTVCSDSDRTILLGLRRSLEALVDATADIKKRLKRLESPSGGEEPQRLSISDEGLSSLQEQGVAEGSYVCSFCENPLYVCKCKDWRDTSRDAAPLRVRYEESKSDGYKWPAGSKHAVCEMDLSSVKVLNGFNNGRDTTDGVGGRSPEVFRGGGVEKDHKPMYERMSEEGFTLPEAKTVMSKPFQSLTTGLPVPIKVYVDNLNVQMEDGVLVIRKCDVLEEKPSMQKNIESREVDHSEYLYDVQDVLSSSRYRYKGDVGHSGHVGVSGFSGFTGVSGFTGFRGRMVPERHVTKEEVNIDVVEHVARERGILEVGERVFKVVGVKLPGTLQRTNAGSWEKVRDGSIHFFTATVGMNTIHRVLDISLEDYYAAT